MYMHNPEAPRKIAVVNTSTLTATINGNMVQLSGFDWGDMPEFNYEKLIEHHKIAPTTGTPHSVTLTLPSVPASGDIVWVTLYIGNEKYFVRYVVPTPPPATVTPIINYIANRIQSLFGEYATITTTTNSITIVAKQVGEPFGIAYSSHWSYTLNSSAAPSVGQPQNLLDLGVPATIVNTSSQYFRYDLVVDFDSPSTSNVHGMFTRWSPVERRVVFTIFIERTNTTSISNLDTFLASI